MSHRDGFQPGVPCWIASVHADPAQAVGFYQELLGWEARDTMPDSENSYFVCTLHGRAVAAIGSQRGGPPPRAVWGTQIWVESADEVAERVTAAGGSILMEPFDLLDAARMAVVADPTGAVFGLWQANEHRGAQVVNEPGAWSMSLLNTRDPEASSAFYGAVFGWVAEPMGMGEMQMLRLPDFVGGEPQQPVPRDLVAVLNPMSAHQFPDEVPSHWAVDFWVHDTDAAAEKAAQLGGTVLVPPFEIPAGVTLRQAVLADPEGAAFSVTKVSVRG